MPVSLAELHTRLTRDPHRTAGPEAFSESIRTANVVLLDPFATDIDRREAMECWLQGHQPCLFGRVAAKQQGIQFCFLTTADIHKTDDHIRSKIASARQLWKQRAFRGEPRHGFLLSVCDEKVAFANPDENLRQYSLRLQELAGWPTRPDIGNLVVDEWLYLRHPTTDQIAKFVFSVDYFATAADGRWWHDHRIPGGIAFTANSLGHMVRYKEWYLGKRPQTEWALRTAMSTIASAAKETGPGHSLPHGPATYLLTETPGRPIRPYDWKEPSSPAETEKLKGKDCGSYGGYLHTDHAVRDEFFHPGDVPFTKDTPYLMDFTYIFDPASGDHAAFLAGHSASEAEVQMELGPAEDMRVIAAEPPEDTARHPRPASPPGSRFESALSQCRSWSLTDEAAAAIG